MALRWQDTIDAEVVLDTMVCVNCGIPFAVPRDLVKELRRNGRAFYCPNGHQQGWWESEADRLRAQVRKLQLRADADRGNLDAARVTLKLEQRQHAATKGKLTKERKRAGAGVCPVDDCRRSFTNLRLHMTSKHPSYQEVRLPAGADDRRRVPTVRLDKRVPEAYRGALTIVRQHRGGRTYRCACGELLTTARGIAYAHADHCQAAQRAIRTRQGGGAR